MSAIKSVVKFLADRFLTKEDLLPGLLAQQNPAERANSAISFYKREAALLQQGSKAYNDAVKAAEDLLVTHYRASSFVQLCRSQVRKTAKPEYYAIATIGQIIEAHKAENREVDVTPVVGGEASALLSSINDALIAAKAETNFIKRRSIVRRAILAQLPGISSDRSAQLTELALFV